MPEWIGQSYIPNETWEDAETWEDRAAAVAMATSSNDDASWSEKRHNIEIETGNDGQSATWETGATEWYSSEWGEPIYEERHGTWPLKSTAPPGLGEYWHDEGTPERVISSSWYSECLEKTAKPSKNLHARIEQKME